MLIYDGNSPESGQRGNLPQHNKGHMWQTHSKHHSQWQKTEIISPKIRNKTKVCILATFIQRSFERITTNWKILKEMGIPDDLTCLLRNLYAAQEATVRITCGTMDWFKIGKGVCQGCLWTPCLFKLYAEYII